MSIRIDGRDTIIQPVPLGYFAATSIWFRWEWIPRHDAAQLVGFDEAANEAHLVTAWGNATNYVSVFANAANQIRLEYDAGAAGVQFANWACAGQIVAATTYLMEVRGVPGFVRLIVDGAVVAQIAAPMTFTVIPANIYWGSRQAGDRQVDACYDEP